MLAAPAGCPIGGGPGVAPQVATVEHSPHAETEAAEAEAEAANAAEAEVEGTLCSSFGVVAAAAVHHACGKILVAGHARMRIYMTRSLQVL